GVARGAEDGRHAMEIVRRDLALLLVADAVRERRRWAREEIPLVLRGAEPAVAVRGREALVDDGLDAALDRPGVRAPAPIARAALAVVVRAAGGAAPGGRRVAELNGEAAAEVRVVPVLVADERAPPIVVVEGEHAPVARRERRLVLPALRRVERRE